MFVVGALDDLRDVSPPAKLAGRCWPASLLVAVRRRRCSSSGCRSTSCTPTSSCSRPTSRRSSPCSWVVLIDQRDQPHRRPRRPRGRHRRRSPAARCSCSPTGCSRTASSTARTSRPLDRDHRGRACASASCRSTVNPAKIFMGDAGALFLGLLLAVPTITIGGRTDYAVHGQHVLLLRAPADPGADPRRADPRHRVLVHPPDRAAPALAPGRRRPPAPPADAPRPRPAPHGRDPLGVDRPALGRRAGPDVLRRRATRSCPFVVAGLALLLFAGFHPGRRGSAREKAASGGPSRRAEPPSRSTGRRCRATSRSDAGSGPDRASGPLRAARPRISHGDS